MIFGQTFLIKYSHLPYEGLHTSEMRHLQEGPGCGNRAHRVRPDLSRGLKALKLTSQYNGWTSHLDSFGMDNVNPLEDIEKHTNSSSVFLEE